MRDANSVAGVQFLSYNIIVRKNTLARIKIIQQEGQQPRKGRLSFSHYIADVDVVSCCQGSRMNFKRMISQVVISSNLCLTICAFYNHALLCVALGGAAQAVQQLLIS